jgi:ribosomal-protein-alanine N-acetyltransferase
MNNTQHLYIKTKRLECRPLTLQDYSLWKTAHSQTLPQQNLFDRAPKTPDQLTLTAYKKILKQQALLRKNDKYYDIAVFENKTKRLIGSVSIMDVIRGLGSQAYLGYGILNHEWGKGYGKEATLALIHLAFRELNIHRLEAGIEKTNTRSLRLAKSIGLKRERIKERAVYLRDAWQDLIVMVAFSEDFGYPIDPDTLKTRLR